MRRYRLRILPVLSLLLIFGCAHKYSEAEYLAVSDQLDICRQELQMIQEDNAQLSEKLGSVLGELDKTGSALSSLITEKQELLDRSIQCLEENKVLMKQVSQSNARLQENKESQWRMSKGYEYILSFLETERLRDQVYIIRAPDNIKVVIPQRTLFPTAASAWLTPRGSNLIRKIALGLKQLNPASIEIAGHTDNTPVSGSSNNVYPTNWHLAQARAMSVLLVFNDSDIPKEKLCSVSFGDTKPIADNASEEGRAMNRRVEILIVP
jgi:chemotaxis protein MotB